MRLATRRCVKPLALVVFVALAVPVAACTHGGSAGGRREVTGPRHMCRPGTDTSECRPIASVAAMLARDDLEILEVGPPPSGKQGARVLVLRTGGASPVVFRAKWRAHSTTGRRNYPRYELAAYTVQQLFLDPDHYVVPPAAGHCFPLAAYRAHVDPTAQPTFVGAECVYGVLSYWLEDVEPLADALDDGWFEGSATRVLDPERFWTNRVYRDSVAAVNLFTYVFRHADPHLRNLVVAKNHDSPVVYTVDNSLALGMPKNRKLLPANDLSELRVPAVPRAAIERLRAALDDLHTLAVIARFRLRAGQLVAAPLAGASPARVAWDGEYLTVGLTPDEIDLIRSRIVALLDRADRGEIRMY
jgi:hypothetical protein